jgi:hypothetical protein
MFKDVRRCAAALASSLLLVVCTGGFLFPNRATAGNRRDFGTSSTRVENHSATSTGSVSTSTSIVNVPVCLALYDQNAPVLVPYGGGGVIAAWSDYRNGTLDIYAQKLNWSGTSQWSSDGMPACKAAGNQSNPQAAPDGAGGMIVVWQDERSVTADIYAQRLNSVGAAVWTGAGVVVSNAANGQRNPAVVSDGVGGAIIAWVDERGADADVYVQRLNSMGVPQWTANGVALCVAAGAQDSLSVVTDGLNGAVVCWQDGRGADRDIYAQQVNAAGAPQWTANGVAVCAAAGQQLGPVALADGAGGTILTWCDDRGADADVYAQRLDGAGTMQWTANGVLVCGAAGDQERPQLCTDGANGVVLAWEDRRGAEADVYARRVNAAGIPQWAPDGVAVCTAATDQLAPAIVVDPAGGAVVTWTDARNPSNGNDIYVQHVQLDGTRLWTADGVLVCDAGDHQDLPAVFADGSGAAIALWRDRRSGSFSDVYAQQVDAYGQIPNQCTPPDSLLSNLPVTTVALQNHRKFRQAAFFWSGVAVRGLSGDWDIEVYDTGPSGVTPYPTCFGLPLAGSYGNSGVDFVVGNFNNDHTPPATYNTRAWRYNGTGDATMEWDDGPDQFSPDVLVTSSGGWTGPIDVYDVPLISGNTYWVELTHDPGMELRAFLFTSYGSPGYYYFAPRSENVLEVAGRYGSYTAVSSEYYGVVVTNENGVPGTYQLKVSTSTPVGAGDEAPIASTGIRGLAPNPAAGRVQIDFAMQRPGAAAFEIHDMAGRRVASIPSRSFGAGRWSVQWDGQGITGRSVSPGLYFVQMKVDGRTVATRRLALIP